MKGSSGKTTGRIRRTGYHDLLKSFLLSFTLVNSSFAWTTCTSATSRRGTSRARHLNDGRRVHRTYCSHLSSSFVGVDDSIATRESPLSCTFDELSAALGGTGRALAVWEYYRRGLDPIAVEEAAAARTTGKIGQDDNPLPDSVLVGSKTRKLLKHRFGGPIRDTVAKVVTEAVSNDGTTKLLLELAKDKLQVETVIIPWDKRQRSTLCVSSQVGCQQACTFCQTGRMGKLRSLSADEILAQLFIANKAVAESRQGDGRTKQLYDIDNIVFMGMGEPADNADEVVRAVNVLTDTKCGFCIAPKRVTISTVAPTPTAFRDLGRAPAVLAWSAHSSRDEIRRQLVPTTRNTMSELRGGFIETLLSRSRSQRSAMLEVTLLGSVNDSEEDALHLASFCQPILQQVQRLKLVVNLIPWNEISAPFGPASYYQKPSLGRVLAFQEVLVGNGIRCYIRQTRGDDESAGKSTSIAVFVA